MPGLNHTGSINHQLSAARVLKAYCMLPGLIYLMSKPRSVKSFVNAMSNSSFDAGLVARMSSEAARTGGETIGPRPAGGPSQTEPTELTPPAEPTPPAEVFLTGGAGAVVAGLIGPHARAVPHLTLSGIHVAAQAIQRHASRRDSP